MGCGFCSHEPRLLDSEILSVVFETTTSDPKARFASALCCETRTSNPAASSRGLFSMAVIDAFSPPDDLTLTSKKRRGCNRNWKKKVPFRGLNFRRRLLRLPGLDHAKAAVLNSLTWHSKGGRIAVLRSSCEMRAFHATGRQYEAQTDGRPFAVTFRLHGGS